SAVRGPTGRRWTASGTKGRSRFWMPCLSVAVDDGQPEHEPFMLRKTMPSLKPRNVMSPPSLATAGRTRASISSLMVATVSASLASKTSSLPAGAAASAPRTIGVPDMKCSMMAPRIAGLSCGHSPVDLVTAMKSAPKKTPETPATSNSRSASGDWAAASLSRMSSVPFASTGRPGRNLSVAGFGVGSGWMNMVCSSAAAERYRGLRAGSRRFDHCNRWRRAVEVQGMDRAAAAAGGRAGTTSRHGVEVLVAEVAGYDRDRDREFAVALANARNQRSRPLLVG